MGRYEYSEEHRKIMEQSLVPYVIYQFVDKRVVTLILSDGFLEMFGYTDRATAIEDMDNNMYRNTHPDDVARISDAAVRFATLGEKYDVVYRTRMVGSEEYRIIHSKGTHFTTDTGVRLAQVMYTDEGVYSMDPHANETPFGQSLNEALHRESIIRSRYYDYLTGLPSMSYFFELAEAGCRTMKENGIVPAFLFLDLNGMKYYNHQHGFAEGDVLLRSFAQLLVDRFGNENCSRFGGDHFTVFTVYEGVEETLQEIFEEWERTAARSPLPIKVGIYQDTTKDLDISLSCDRAKMACDKLKNTYVSGISVFDRQMQVLQDNKQYIISHIDQALEERWIEVYFQPIVRTINGKVCDEEALARWIDPELGFLSPDRFIPILEETRLIYKLDLYVVDRIIEKIGRIRKEGLYAVPQSVNLSRADFEVCDIVTEICDRMDAAGVEHSLLTIEITESVVGSDFEFMRRQMERFRNAGFQIWMDDFGSGYSSLDVLHSLKFDVIKFDMRFMQQIDESESGRVILTELMKMATALGVDTVCEGVETEQHVNYLREIGCSKLQGYYYSKPIPLREILARYEEGRAIGFEDPKQSAYYETIGRINLYDLSALSTTNEEDFRRAFETVPMAIMELVDDQITVTRTNKAYRDFAGQMFDFTIGNQYDLLTDDGQEAVTFLRNIATCAKEGGCMVIDERFPDRTTIHSFIRRIALNPVTGVGAVAVAVLAVTDDSAGATYENIARSLAADYSRIFYVNVETEDFYEYASKPGQTGMWLEKQGKDFFTLCRHDAESIVYGPDQAGFIASFTKERIISTIKEQKNFTLTYRIMENGMPVYTNMKAMPMENDPVNLVIATTNIDAQMQRQRAFERIRRGQVMYNRICAIAGDFICVYVVEPETGRYVEYTSTDEYDTLGVTKEGEDFFADGKKNAENVIHPDDLWMFSKMFSKEDVLEMVRKTGLYEIKYRLMLKGEAKMVSLRAAVVREDDGDKLIVGILG